MAPTAYSTVSFPMRPYEIMNTLQTKMDSFKQEEPQSRTSTARANNQNDTVYSDPASENCNRYATAREQPTRHEQRRQRTDHEGSARHLIHLSDLETLDSTRPSVDPRSNPSQRRHEPMSSNPGQFATVVPTRHQYQNECDRITQLLISDPSISTHMGARPKQTAVRPPTVPPTAGVQQGRTKNSNLTQAASVDERSDQSDMPEEADDTLKLLFKISPLKS